MLKCGDGGEDDEEQVNEGGEEEYDHDMMVSVILYEDWWSWTGRSLTWRL